MRTLSSSTTAAKEARNATPRYILKIEFGGAVGTKYYSSIALGDGDGSSLLDAAARVMSWGQIDSMVSENEKHAVSDLQLELKDDDKVLDGYYDQVEFQGKKATVYVWFDGLLESDAAPVLGGVLDEPVTWDWAKGTVTLDVTDISTYHRTTIGNVADRDTFERVSGDDEGEVLPLVFGRCQYVPARYVESGLRTRLIRPCGPNDTYLYVEDAEDFPQDEEVTLFIEREVIKGSFHGNKLTVTERGAALVASTTTDDPPEDDTWGHKTWQLVDTNLGGTPADWLYYQIEVHDPDGAVHFRSIEHYWVETGVIEFHQSIYYEGSPWWIPSGTDYRIVSLPESHGAGAPVTLKLERYVYIANDAPSKRVRAVYGWGTIDAVQHSQLEPGATQAAPYQIETYIPIGTYLYAVDTNDTTTFPGLGRAVTTITLERPVSHYNSGLKDDSLWVDLDGVEDAADGTGELVENPALVIRELLVRWIGLSAAEINAASFRTARDTLSYLKFGFAVEDEWDGVELCADLAFQARSALLWDDGVARLKVLRNVMESPVAEITSSKKDLSLQVLRTQRDEVCSRVTASYRRDDGKASVAVEDAAVKAWQDKNWDLNLFAYSSRSAALSVAQFWLARRKKVYEIVKLRVMLRGLELQRLDTISLDLPDFWSGYPRLLVTEIRHDLGDAERRMTQVELAGRIMADVSCGAGESGEELPCWACESECQVACELFCMSAIEIECGSGDTDGGGGTGPCDGCENSCQAACETSCQGESCEMSCQVGCETNCQTGCEGSCQTQCVVQCETDCQVGCQEGCETDCQSACEAACESKCETGCETGCEISCESTCQTDCQVECESACEATCEVVCESGCETSCESGCETSCESGCETSCETACETSCETGCETSCETACETSCETGCETSCESGCETSCETACETSCETGCETSEELSCGDCANYPTSCYDDACNECGDTGAPECIVATTEGTVGQCAAGCANNLDGTALLCFDTDSTCNEILGEIHCYLNYTGTARSGDCQLAVSWLLDYNNGFPGQCYVEVGVQCVDDGTKGITYANAFPGEDHSCWETTLAHDASYGDGVDGSSSTLTLDPRSS